MLGKADAGHAWSTLESLGPGSEAGRTSERLGLGIALTGGQSRVLQPVIVRARGTDTFHL